ncbi:hypothetical protein TGME49_314020 [Toxoplasma gondii ME49]|uniref:DUF7164 domain-containing protein n=4 Tax=Toxoplasma gondii TaxID=5811 RepID=S8GBY5_TOXGM|nr:hypothetical protein TGME49_314020 [Toxoplasma gondii ME49]EPT25859.1 hypothetical protein TGME49_314020 [Toxoplasma gondii ME49]ESS35208.1 putative transmembrane protein [Toxoplasma gondii VEG]CEL77640.1 TPA: hypothetical protein BN1205_099170 [Toxoplasma gondii VEG]|eukprot:XP_018635389.1 hypothetical protein TGME49_314020 [Toxoplasma gondii ME49]
MAGRWCVEWAPRLPRLVPARLVPTPLFLVAASAGLCLLWFAVTLSWQTFSALHWAPSSLVSLSEDSRGSSELEASMLYTPADLAGLRPQRETQEKWRVVNERLPPRYPSLETRASRSSASSLPSSARGVPASDRARSSHVSTEDFGEILPGSLSGASRDPEDRRVSFVRLTEKERFLSLADFPDMAHLALQGVASADATFNSPLEDLSLPSSASREPTFSSGSASPPVAPLSVASPASLGTPMSPQELSEEPVPGVDFPATRVFFLFVPQEHDSGGAAEEQIVQAFGFVESWRFVFGVGEKPEREPRLATSRLGPSRGVWGSGDVAGAGKLGRIWRPPLRRWRARKHPPAPRVSVHPSSAAWGTDAADSDTRNSRRHVEESNHEKSGEEKKRKEEGEVNTLEKKAEHKREKANGEAKSKEKQTVTTARKESSHQSGSREIRDGVGPSLEGKEGDWVSSAAGRSASSQQQAETSESDGKATWWGGHADGEGGARRLEGEGDSRTLHTHDHRVVETPVVNDILFVTEMKMQGANVPWICDELSSFSSLDAFREDLIKRIRLGLAQRKRANGDSRAQKPARGVDSRPSSEASHSGDSSDEDFYVNEFKENSLNQDSSSSSSSFFSSVEGKSGESVNRCIVVRVTIDATQRSEIWQLHPAMHSVSAATHPLVAWLLQQYDLAMRSDNDTFLTPALLRRENTPWLSRVARSVQPLRKEATPANRRRRREKGQLKRDRNAQMEETEKAGEKKDKEEERQQQNTADGEEKEGKRVGHSVRENAHRRRQVMTETEKSVEIEEGGVGSMLSVSGSREEGAVDFRDAVRLGQNADDGDTASMEETETGEVKFAFFTGRGGYFNQKNRKILPEYASLLGLRFQNLGLVGSTWYGRPADIVAAARYTVKIGEFLMKVDPVFQRGAGEWPAWYRGVLLLYSAELAVNHLVDREDVFIRSDLLDTESTAGVDWRTSPALHVHCWHTQQFFSKFAFFSGEYPLYWFQSPEFDFFDIRWYSYTNALNGRERRRLQIESLKAVRESLLREVTAGESGDGRAASSSGVSEDAMFSAAPSPPLSSKLTASLSLPWSSFSLFALPRVARSPHARRGEPAARAASFRTAPLSFELARLAFPFQACPFESPFPVHEGGSTRCCPRPCAKSKKSKDDACCGRSSSGYRCPAPPCLHPSEFLWLLDSIAALSEDEVLAPVSEAERAKPGETEGVDATGGDRLRLQQTHAGLLRGSDASPAACPAFFPFPFEGGRQCCATNKDCDGNPLGLESRCCWHGDSRRCWPTGATTCVAHPGVQMLSLEHGLTNSVGSASVLSPARRSAPGDRELMARVHASTVPELAKFLGGLGPADRGGALYAVEEQGTSLEALRQFRFTLQKEAFL